MCGIVGYVGRQDALPILFAGLHRLEYRGYDSAGVAVITRSGLKVHKAAGKVRQVEATAAAAAEGDGGHRAHALGDARRSRTTSTRIRTSTAAATSRWCTTASSRTPPQLRAELEAKGHVFHSDTDTEVLAHLIEAFGGELDQAVRQTLSVIEGTYGIAVVDARQPDRIVAARNGSPVVIGIGDKEMFVASDVVGTGALHRAGASTSTTARWRWSKPAATAPRRSTTARPTRAPSTVQWGHEAYDRGDARALHAQGDPRAAGGVRAHARRAGSTCSSAPPTSAGSTSRRATCSTSSASRSSAAARPTTPASAART